MTISTLPNTLAGTKRMQVDPEALHGGEGASESSVQSFPISDAHCSAFPENLDWVPDRERTVVPDLMAALCRSCPGRQQCLLWALAEQEHGCWNSAPPAPTAPRCELRVTSTWPPLSSCRRRRDSRPPAGRCTHWGRARTSGTAAGDAGAPSAGRPTPTPGPSSGPRPVIGPCAPPDRGRMTVMNQAVRWYRKHSPKSAARDAATTESAQL